MADDDRFPKALHPGPHGWAEDFLNQVPFEDLGASLLRFAGDVVEAVLNPDRGAALFSALIRSLPMYEAASEDERGFDNFLQRGDWRSAIQGHLFALDLQDIFANFAWLYAFGRGGEGPGRTPDESRQRLERLLAQCRALEGLIPAEFTENLEFWPWLTDTLAAAETRWALDNGRPVSSAGLASLAGVSTKTLANLTAAKTLSTDADGLVPAAVALEYLTRRKDFVTSSWQQPIQPTEAEPAGVRTLIDPVWLPVDSDGQPFLPSLARPSRGGEARYALGDKASPEYVSDYWHALDRLSQMPTPRWRRPNAQGHWGLVTAQESWKRFARSDLERMVEAVRNGQ